MDTETLFTVLERLTKESTFYSYYYHGWSVSLRLLPYPPVSDNSGIVTRPEWIHEFWLRKSEKERSRRG